MKKRYLVILPVVVFGLFFFWLVERAGAPLDRTIPKAPSTNHDTPDPSDRAGKEGIVIDTPRINAQVTSPLVIKGSALGNWYFEGSFPVILTDWDGKIIAQGNATAQGSWMTSGYVPFVATIEYVLPQDIPFRTGYLILKKDNPSGDPLLGDSIKIMIQL